MNGGTPRTTSLGVEYPSLPWFMNSARAYLRKASAITSRHSTSSKFTGPSPTTLPASRKSTRISISKTRISKLLAETRLTSRRSCEENYSGLATRQLNAECEDPLPGRRRPPKSHRYRVTAPRARDRFSDRPVCSTRRIGGPRSPAIGSSARTYCRLPRLREHASAFWIVYRAPREPWPFLGLAKAPDPGSD